MFQGWMARSMAAVLCAMVLVGCGGSDRDSSVTAEIGAGGGTVSHGQGASVFVPVGAVDEGRTLAVRLAVASSLPLPLPASHLPAGAAYEITPHGHHFARLVEVRIPVPDETLPVGHRWLLAKLTPGQGWEFLSETALVDGMLTARMMSFSVITAVTVAIPPTVANTTLTCGDDACDQLSTSRVTVSYDWSRTGAAPAECESGSLQMVIETVDPGVPAAPVVIARQTVAEPVPAGGRYTAMLAAPVSRSMYLTGSLRCRLQSSPSQITTLAAAPVRTLAWPRHPAYPGVGVLQAPAVLTVTAGAPATLTQVFAGGAGGPTGSEGVPLKAPTASDSATVQWHFSRDDGATWSAQPAATSAQHEGQATPLADESEPWWAWSSSYRFVPTDAEQGALVRATVCYTAPQAASPRCSNGPATRLTVLQQAVAPSITTAPEGSLVLAGQSARLVGAASGEPMPMLQWQTRAPGATAWADVAGATGAEWVTAPLTPADNGRAYRMVATNSVASVSSAPALVAVSDQPLAPVITVQPSSFAAIEGGMAVFAAAAEGTAPLSYQWYYNGRAVTGSPGSPNSPLWRMSSVYAPNAGDYRLVVSNAYGSVTSAVAVLSVGTAPPVSGAVLIVTDPAAASVDVGSTAVFGVGASGAPPLAYQWLRDGVPIAGATSATHVIPSAQLADVGNYSVQLSSDGGTPVTSRSAQLRVTTATQLLAPVALLAQPAPQIQAAGGSATFSVGASGGAPLRFQWFKDGTALAGATQPQLVLGNLGSTDVGRYAVEISNDVNRVTSDSAPLVVLGVPAITTQPASTSVASGQSATFRVAAAGENLRYQWTLNSVAIGGATAAAYTTPARAAADSGSVYGVVVFNGMGLVVSEPAVLTVTP